MYKIFVLIYFLWLKIKHNLIQDAKWMGLMKEGDE